MDKRLRVVGFQVLPAVVWDDGESLSPGPPLEAVQVTPADLAGSPFLARFLAELAAAEVPDEALPPPQPNRAARRAQTRKKPPAKTRP